MNRFLQKVGFLFASLLVAAVSVGAAVGPATPTAQTIV